jgi:Sulfatase-modifying factor enzyme 1
MCSRRSVRLALVAFGVAPAFALALTSGVHAGADDATKNPPLKKRPAIAEGQRHHDPRPAAGHDGTPAPQRGHAADGTSAPAPKRGHAPKPAGRNTAGSASGVAHRHKPRCDEGHLPPAVRRAACPAEMTNVDDRFCIDRWEDALVETFEDGREVPWPPFGAVEDGHAFRAVSRPRVYPQAYISGEQAARACAAAGKRLCAPIEWRKACMGPNETTFGYGRERIAGRCNDSGRSPMLRLFPQVAISWTTVGMTEMNDARLNQLDGTLAPTGSHEECTNEYGVFDMVGNLHEWTSDPNGTFQGGYYLDTHRNGDGCAYRTVAHEFSYHDYSTGFRCCADPSVREFASQ